MSAILEAFAIDSSSGALSTVSGSPFSAKASFASDFAVAPNNSSAYLLGQQYGSSCCVGPTDLQVFSLDPKSGVPALKESLPTGQSAFENLVIHPSGTFLFVTPWNSDGSGTGIFTLGSDGSATFSSTSPTTGSEPVISTNGQFLYTTIDVGPVGNWSNTQACGPVETDVYGYSVNQTSGALTPLASNPVKFQRNECEVGHQSTALLGAVDGQSQRLFLVDEANSNLLTFNIGPNGDLSQPQTTAVKGFSSLVIDPQSRFLYIGGILEFTGYNIASSTTTPIPGLPMNIQPVPADNETGSTTMAIDPTGTYLFSNQNGYTSAFSCCDADGLVEFKIDQNSGALTQMTVTPSSLKGSASKMAFTNYK